MQLKLIVSAAVLVLAGCQSAAPPPPRVPVASAVPNLPNDPNDPPFWGRQDCKRLSSDPSIKNEFDRDKAACEAQTGVPAENITVSMIYYCMADKSYNYRTRGEHDKACSIRGPARTTRR